MEKISVLDTTLRDGAQIPGFKMSLDEKLNLAKGLKALNVDVIEAGARQVECSVNGIGDRAGNASLEELVMTLKSRKDYYDVEVDIHTQEIFPLSDYLCRTSGIPIHSYKPIVGIN
ncbi:MAG TPA: 2-isopropylmalate synthase, partial [Spirochaetes bacterium]|nr:2-isopropylmalate synthase [Spirochaetota bacterium]